MYFCHWNLVNSDEHSVMMGLPDTQFIRHNFIPDITAQDPLLIGNLLSILFQQLDDSSC
jgi:hypothetical protein